MKNLANVLSTFRLFGSVVASIFILLGFDWALSGARTLLALASVTEPLDGEAARLQERRGNLAKPWFAETGKGFNELATAALTIAVPAAIELRLVLATVFGWPDGYLKSILLWGAICLFFFVATLAFNWCREHLVPFWAEVAEVLQAWFAGFIVGSCAYVEGASIRSILVVATIVGALAFVGTRNRLLFRVDERPSYEGKLHPFGRFVH